MRRALRLRSLLADSDGWDAANQLDGHEAPVLCRRRRGAVWGQTAGTDSEARRYPNVCELQRRRLQTMPQIRFGISEVICPTCSSAWEFIKHDSPEKID